MEDFNEFICWLIDAVTPLLIALILVLCIAALGYTVVEAFLAAL